MYADADAVMSSLGLVVSMVSRDEVRRVDGSFV